MVTVVEEHPGVFNRRFGIELSEDGARVEAVLYASGESLCISSQVGCAVGCPFCASGAHGFGRNLRPDELWGQVEAVLALGHNPRRITVSGVGEPLHNHTSVCGFVDRARDEGLPTSITTSGGPLSRLDAWITDVPHRGVTISVHAGTEGVRSRAVPRGPALGPLFDRLRESLRAVSARRRRRVALAYLLLPDLNDSDEELGAFIDRARPLGLKIHLYAYNPVPTSTQRPTDPTRYQRVYDRMRVAGFDVRRSSQTRVEKNGGCGTLIAIRRPPPTCPPSEPRSG